MSIACAPYVVVLDDEKDHSVPRIRSVRQGALRLAAPCTSPYIHESDLVA
jgi:hypothetical protein